MAKLKWRIFAFLLGFCALLLIILWLFQTVLLTDMYKAVRRREIERAIVLVEQNINSPSLREIFYELETEKEILVMPALDFVIPPHMTGGQPAEARTPRRPSRVMPEVITQTRDFVLQDGGAISLTFFAMITPVDATVSTLRTQLFMITAVMVLLSVLLAVVISRRISEPIEVLNKSAKLLARGNYETRFDGKGFLEIEELSATLNTAAAELSKVERLRRELMANVSHDLRTPLALIYSYTEMMHDFPLEITPLQTQTIMDETKRLTSLVNDILDISQLEAGSMELRMSNFCLTDSICETISRTTELLKDGDCAIEFDYGENVYINADELKIIQAFYNLLINAVNYSGHIKKISVRQSVLQDCVRIEVADNGEGISPNELPYVWERYYTAEKKHKRPVAGTGLGLSIVKKIIDMHGGRCGVVSEVDKGSVFWFEVTFLNC